MKFFKKNNMHVGIWTRDLCDEAKNLTAEQFNINKAERWLAKISPLII